jgi:mono/diheme cytochrome c family protein
MVMKLEANVLFAAIGTVFLLACGDVGNQPEEEVASTEQAVNQTFAQHQAACQADPRVQSGVVSLTECIGADIFFKENFNGNGRTCGTCHRVERNFAIDPAFIARLPNSDKLFIAEHTTDGLPLDNLEIPSQLRARGLILENVDGTQPEGPTVRFVLRSVPHNLSMGVSIKAGEGIASSDHAERTGWSGDGAPLGGTNGSGVTMTGRLDDFTMGAINQHFTRSLNRVPGVDFRKSTEQEGAAVATFMKRLGRLNDINLNGVSFSDAGAEAGRQRFNSVGCDQCHQDAGANSPLAASGILINGNQPTNVESVRHLDLSSFPRDGGDDFFPNQAPPNPMGNTTFNAPPVIEAADSGPFFHTDAQIIGAPAENTPSAQTIEQAVAFYNSQAFVVQEQGTLSAADIANVGRFLRAINAVFNIQMASNRIIGARNMGNALGNVARVDRMQRRMAQMTLFELDDAVRVLSGVANLNVAQANRVRTARTRIETVVNTPGTSSSAFNTRMTNLANAFNDLDLADGEISANVLFQIGNGTRMDCADPSTNTQPGNAPCFNPALRTPAP